MNVHKIILFALVLQLSLYLFGQTSERTTRKPAEKGEDSPCAVGGVPLLADECREIFERLKKRNLETFIPQGFSRGYNENDVKLLKSLDPLIEKLDEFDNSKAGSESISPGPKKAYGKNINLAVKEEEEFKLISPIWVKMWAYDSLKQAEEGLAENASMIQVFLKSGSLTGIAIGELPYHYSQNNQTAYVIFLRRNVVISIAYKGPYQAPKDKRKPHGPFLDDPELRNRCDTLAKNIDDLIVKLTNK